MLSNQVFQELINFCTETIQISSDLDDQVLVVARSEEFVDEEWPGHQYEEQGVAELRLKRKRDELVRRRRHFKKGKKRRE
jgi:hypothetical protein